MRRRRSRRGVSLGTIVMLTLACLVLVGFFALLPRLTGATDVRLNAAELAVALDRSIIQFSNAQPVAKKTAGAQPTPPPQSLATAAPALTAPPKLRFTLCAAGNIRLNAAVQKALTDDSGYRFPMLLENVAQSLEADLTLATLTNSVVPSAKLTDFNQPAELLTALRASGIDALCLGHYAALDGGMDGLAATKQSISAAGMLPYGAYASASERSAPALTTVNGLSVALLSYQNDLNSAGKKRTTAEEQAYAVAKLQLPAIAEDIANARARGAQIVIVSLCWGKTNANAPTQTQEELAQGMADAGADIILGTHPEAVQQVRILTANRGDSQYHPVLCAYSMGNLFTYNREKRVSLAGMLLHAQVEYDSGTGAVAFDNLTYTPTYCWRGKDGDAQRYRVLLSAAATPPDYVDEDQAAVMGRCYQTITDAMEGGVLTQAAR